MELNAKGMIKDLRQIRETIEEQSNRIDFVLDYLYDYIGEEEYNKILREIIGEEEIIRETLERR